jgi:F420-non-reducing hydrogenase iron-sulfur subunit
MSGVSRLQYTPEMKLIRVMCSGRVDIEFVLRAFLNGQDGVFIGGCRLGECNYITHGNYHALNMVTLCSRIMEHIGINPDRLDIEFMSSGDGILFADKINEFTERIKNLGPAEQTTEIKSRLEKVVRLIPYIKIKYREKLSLKTDGGKDSNQLFTEEEINRLFTEFPTYIIDPDKCKACSICKERCPVDAIDGEKKQVHSINQDICIKCGTCIEACPPRFNAVQNISGEPI